MFSKVAFALVALFVAGAASKSITVVNNCGVPIAPGVFSAAKAFDCTSENTELVIFPGEHNVNDTYPVLQMTADSLVYSENGRIVEPQTWFTKECGRMEGMFPFEKTVFACKPNPFAHSGSTIIKNDASEPVWVSTLTFDQNDRRVGDCPSYYNIEHGKNQSLPVEDVTKFVNYVSVSEGKLSSEFGPLTSLSFLDIVGHYPDVEQCKTISKNSVWFAMEAPGDVLTIA